MYQAEREMKDAQSQAINKNQEPHFEGLSGKIGNVQDLAAKLDEGLRGLADRLLGGVPEAPGEGRALREVGFPCNGAVGELFERTSNLDDRLRSALRELDRLNRLA